MHRDQVDCQQNETHPADRKTESQQCTLRSDLFFKDHAFLGSFLTNTGMRILSTSFCLSFSTLQLMCSQDLPTFHLVNYLGYVAMERMKKKRK